MAGQNKGRVSGLIFKAGGEEVNYDRMSLNSLRFEEERFQALIKADLANRIHNIARSALSVVQKAIRKKSRKS